MSVSLTRPAGTGGHGRRDAPEHDELRSLLARVRRRWFAVTILTTGGRAAAAGAAPMVMGAVIAWLTRPSGAVLMGLTLVASAAALAAALFVFFRMRRRPDDCQVARFVEEHSAVEGVDPAISDALVSAVQVAESPEKHPPAFADLIVGNAVNALRRIEPSLVISPAAMRRAVRDAIVGSAILATAVAVGFPHWVRAGATAWVTLFPGSIQIRVHTGNARVPAGQPLRITATIQGAGTALLGVVPSLVVSADGQQRAVPMSASEHAFVYSFESVDRSFTYQVTAGAASSAPYSVTALFAPRVTRIDLHYEYPSFTGQRAREEKDGGDIYGPAGTRVGLRIHTDKPVASGELALAEDHPVSLRHTGDGTVAADLVLTKDDGYRVKLSDADGLHSAGELEYFIRVMDDRPPDVRIVRPGADQGITPLEEVAIEARADDDYGVARFDLVYTVAGKPPRIVPFTRVSGTDVARIGSHLLAAEDLGVQPGDVITYYARARDVARGKRSTETRSDIFFLEVKPFNEEFVAAQSQGMGGAGGTQIDSLIAAQKEIINATWNLERRAGAGRSATDMKAVGQAQAELKARVEQMVRRGRRGALGGLPPQQVLPSRQPQPPRGGTDPVGAAVQAMGRAVDQLGRARTAEAIPHEMEALQGLLQVQAEVRRREVMQQSASSAGQGGTSRTDRDLSALFDRELQRQQRTNYETSRSSQTPEREDRSDALDRIRDLARRQEELARRQRDLSNRQIPSEEMRRQLERLTREQEELRQQAEELRKQQRPNGGRASGDPKARDGSTSGPWSDVIGRAAEQMRRAASEMQRQNAEGAAASSEKAAEALRQSERQMRGGSADARQRAAGDLQLEAQQIADAQRRIASEMSRLEKDGQANADALRRLAAEKDKLADRVDDLQRTARELERETPGAAGGPLRDAAQQIQGQRIGERMRSTAGDMRDRAAERAGGQKGAGQPQAQAEQQLSRALDSVVDKLGGNTDTRRMTDELDRARGMRERLSDLEQQVRDAEQSARDAQTAQSGMAPQRGREGRSGRQGNQQESAEQQLQRARDAYGRELQRSRESLSRLQSSPQRDGLGGSTPEHHEFSRSAPGNESFKQDFSGWEKLRQDVDLRLERYESAVAARLARKLEEDRLSAGGSERVPDAYRRSVSRYFESLAKEK